MSLFESFLYREDETVLVQGLFDSRRLSFDEFLQIHIYFSARMVSGVDPSFVVDDRQLSSYTYASSIRSVDWNNYSYTYHTTNMAFAELVDLHPH